MYMLTSCFLGELSGFGLNGIWTAILLSHIAAALFAGITAAKTARMQSTKA